MNPLNDPTIAYLRALLGVRLDRARAETDRGASAIEWAIITALLAGIAIAVGAIIIKKVSDKANSINTG
ncbi:hypothetical protein ACGFNU_25470 [Spirillospora sp. NPDC048911]|uniref:hypothetical protein n=1 Tax=Spirillospora sp. NPDC048911 TaxID=3364527 RepID=UPI003723B9FF